MVDFKLAIRSISSYTVDFQLYGRFPAIRSFYKSYMVDFTKAIWSISHHNVILDRMVS